MKTSTDAGQRLGRFFALAFGIAWGLWIAAALTGQDAGESPTVILTALGGFGPSAAGVILLFREATRAERRDVWRRLVDIRLIGGWWYIALVLVFPATFSAALRLYLGRGGVVPVMPDLARVIEQPGALRGMLPAMLIAGPMSEELGWRGYALDRLQVRWSPLVSSLILGAVWGVWHAPLFLIRGTIHYAMGFGSAGFWLFLISFAPLSIIMTWAYNSNRRSILAAVLLHFTYDLTMTLLYPLSEMLSGYWIVTLSVAAAAMIAGEWLDAVMADRASPSAG